MELMIAISGQNIGLDTQLKSLFAQYKEAYQEKDTDKVERIFKQVRQFGKDLIPYIEKVVGHPCKLATHPDLIKSYTPKSLDYIFQYGVTNKSTRFKVSVYIRFQRKPTYKGTVTVWAASEERATVEISSSAKPVAAALKALKSKVHVLFDGTAEERYKQAQIKLKQKDAKKYK